jgi:hypothetical protein
VELEDGVHPPDVPFQDQDFHTQGQRQSHCRPERRQRAGGGPQEGQDEGQHSQRESDRRHRHPAQLGHQQSTEQQSPHPNGKMG